MNIEGDAEQSISVGRVEGFLGRLSTSIVPFPLSLPFPWASFQSVEIEQYRYRSSYLTLVM